MLNVPDARMAGGHVLSKEDQTTLNSLRWHWQDDYYIRYSDGAWRATPFADRSVLLVADTGYGLKTEIQDDYAERASASRSGYWPAGNSGP